MPLAATTPVYARPSVYDGVGQVREAGAAGVTARAHIAAVILAGLTTPGVISTQAEDAAVAQALRLTDKLLAAL